VTLAPGVSTFERLRAKHARFHFRDFTIAQEREGLRFTYDFAIEPDIAFRPTVRLNGIDAQAVAHLDPGVLRNLAFHLGLIEIPSYWKATCSPEIIIEAGHLDRDQIAWWHDLLIKGQGEYFYVNQIDFRAPDLVTIRSEGLAARRTAVHRGPLDPNKILIPVGGGKDSAVTLELLGRHFPDAAWWGLNPIPAARAVAGASPVCREVTLSRRIDPKLLELNAAGYLNGHTPFSAYLAFAMTASGILGGYGRAAVSNERSSNEGNVRYLDHDINHQYSKTFAFEQSFREYSARYLSEQFEYLSFVRPLYEIQISRLFARYPHYFSVFRSCNKGSRTNVWCAHCPKCLFVYISLRPFLDRAAMLGIFGQDLLTNPALVDLATELLGQSTTKPFECVGTVAETEAAFALCLETERRETGDTPPLLRLLLARGLIAGTGPSAAIRAILDTWNPEHALPPDLEAILRANLTHEPAR
jgi:hypothetical protein